MHGICIYFIYLSISLIYIETNYSKCFYYKKITKSTFYYYYFIDLIKHILVAFHEKHAYKGLKYSSLECIVN